MHEPEPGMLVSQSVKLVRKLGRGAMGSVWVADHSALDTQVVVKFMSPSLTAHPDLVARFRREASAASRVKSPHVVQTLDHGITDDGLPFITMELLEGRDLGKLLHARGKLPPRDVAVIVVQVAKALSRAHEKGILHRDVKPSNIFLCDVGGGETFVKVLDFGIAKAVHGGGQPFEATESGVIVGTPSFMSPEQLSGGDLDARTDVWALGVVAFRALTGRHPFNGDSLVTLALAIQTGPLPMPTELDPSLPPAIDIWFAKACARDRASRYPSARALAEGLLVALGVQDVAAVGFDASASGETGPVPAVDDQSTEIVPPSLPEHESSTGEGGHVDTSTYKGASYAARPSLPAQTPSRARWVLLAAGILAGALGAVLVMWRVEAGGRTDTPAELPGTRAPARPSSTEPEATGAVPKASSVAAPSASVEAPDAAASAQPSAKAVPAKPPSTKPGTPKPPNDDPFGDHRK